MLVMMFTRGSPPWESRSCGQPTGPSVREAFGPTREARVRPQMPRRRLTGRPHTVPGLAPDRVQEKVRSLHLRAKIMRKLADWQTEYDDPATPGKPRQYEAVMLPVAAIIPPCTGPVAWPAISSTRRLDSRS